LGQPDALVLGDGLMNALGLARRGMEMEALLELDVPTVMVDTWHTPTTGASLDALPDRPAPVPQAVMDWPNRLVPVPFVRPDVEHGCCILPDVVMEAVDGGEVRRSIGLRPEDRTVLWCTAAWQQTLHGSPLIDHAVRTVPELVARTLLPTGAHLLHVGPQPLLSAAAVLRGRYHHSARLPPDRFQAVLQSADVLLSLNAASTVTTVAMELGVPVITLTNPFAGWKHADAVASVPGGATDEVSSWLRDALPLHRWALWPLCFSQTMDSLLNDNPYAEALNRVPLLHQNALAQALEQALGSERTGLIDRQLSYAATVRALPSPQELLLSQLSA
jgi:hypothetical protein